MKLLQYSKFLSNFMQTSEEGESDGDGYRKKKETSIMHSSSSGKKVK